MKKVGINVDGISLHACGNQFTNIYNKNTQYKLYEGISRMYIDYYEQNNPITENSYMVDYVLYVEPTKNIEELRKFASKYLPKGKVSSDVDLEKVVKVLNTSISEVKPIGTKVKLNTIFIVVKNGKEHKWKVIKHPCFNDFTLVRDYQGMTNGVSDKDYNHVCGKTTLETAYKDAFLLS